jgi:hypothetical protein
MPRANDKGKRARRQFHMEPVPFHMEPLPTVDCFDWRPEVELIVGESKSVRQAAQSDMNSQFQKRWERT